MNISSYEKGLGGALTNPTNLSKKHECIVQSYPVVFRGKTFVDAEAAYQHAKSESEFLEMDQRIDLCAEVIAAKLVQHPRLFDNIVKLGGPVFIAGCTHKLPGQYHSQWEGEGLKSPFIMALYKAFMKLARGKYAPGC